MSRQSWRRQFQTLTRSIYEFFSAILSSDCGHVDTSISECYAKKPIECCVNTSGEIVNLCNLKRLPTIYYWKCARRKGQRGKWELDLYSSFIIYQYAVVQMLNGPIMFINGTINLFQTFWYYDEKNVAIYLVWNANNQIERTERPSTSQAETHFYLLPARRHIACFNFWRSLWHR